MKNYKIETLYKMLETAKRKKNNAPTICDMGWGSGMRRSKLYGAQWDKYDNRVKELEAQIKIKLASTEV